MNVPKQSQSSAEPDEQQLFIKNALAGVEKARRFQRIRQIVVTTLAFIAAFWLASKPSGPELNLECTVIILTGLMLGVCTAKVMSLINKSTKTILQAIAELHRGQGA